MIKFGFLANPSPFLKLKKLFYSSNLHFSSSQASFYDILELNRKCTLIDIKKAYYTKVKIYHPDHNEDPKAEEHFKLIVKAYETLKDPSKRYIYDLSEKNPQFREDFKSNDDFVYSEWRETGSSRKYYENKWYGYRKESAKNMRDEYFENQAKDDQETDDFKILLLRLCFVVILIVGFEFWKDRKHEKHKAFRQIKEDLLTNPQYDGIKFILGDNNTKIPLDLGEYIKEREKANAEN